MYRGGRQLNASAPHVWCSLHHPVFPESRVGVWGRPPRPPRPPPLPLPRFAGVRFGERSRDLMAATVSVVAATATAETLGCAMERTLSAISAISSVVLHAAETTAVRVASGRRRRKSSWNTVPSPRSISSSGRRALRSWSILVGFLSPSGGESRRAAASCHLVRPKQRHKWSPSDPGTALRSAE